MSECFGLMQPIELVRKGRGFQIVHRCKLCGKVQPNRVATRTVQCDDFDLILEIMRNVGA